VVEITLRKMKRDGVTIPFMVEKLLGPTAPHGMEEGFVDHFPLGGFLAELEEAKAEPAQAAPNKPKGKGKSAAKK